MSWANVPAMQRWKKWALKFILNKDQDIKAQVINLKELLPIKGEHYIETREV